MNKIIAITVAYAPADQVARGIMEFRSGNTLFIDKHIVVLGHYPINKKKNNRSIAMLCESLGNIELMDPGDNLGSAQSQNYVLERVPCDYFINADPDSSCRTLYSEYSWDEVALEHLEANESCVLMSCWSKLWQPFVDRLSLPDFKDKFFMYRTAIKPIPFNLSIFRVDFIKKIGGLKQWGEKWGELEAPFHAACTRHGKHHSYLMDFVEDEKGKLMQDRQLLEYKDAYMRTAAPNNFMGTFEEFLKWKYPHLLEMDTEIAEGTMFQ